MNNTARRKLAPIAQAPDQSELERSPGVSPVHALQDRLVTHFGAEQQGEAGVLARPVRMALMFWSAVGAWAIVGLSVYGAASLISG